MIIYENIWEISFGIKKISVFKAYFWIWQVTLRGLFSNFDAAVRTWWRISFIFLAGIAVSDSYHRKIVCILSVWEQQVTIISQSHAWGVYRLLKDGVWWRWRMAIEPNLMFLNIIMSTVMVLMLETYQRQFIWIYIFSKGANICQIFDATMCSGSIDFDVFVDCASIFVSGARPCSHDIVN